jgi:UDP-arabinose 4-epimerase
MNILVTGAAGYIGSHACLLLAEAGHAPIGFDDLSTGSRDAVRWGPLVEADLADSSAIRRALREHAIGAVIHFAASAYVGESMTNPRKYYENNTRNAITLLGAMLDEGVQTMIFSSTCATYGIPDQIPITEATPQDPINPYGRSKLFIEGILHDYHHAFGLQYAALRYFNVTGSDPVGRIGESHDPETHLIPCVIGAALGTHRAVQVFGTDYPTRDGSAVRDYVHVLDLVDAHVRALDWLIDNPRETLRLNLGTRHGASVWDVIATTERVLRLPVPYVECPRRAGDPPQLVADSARARQLLDWEPRFTLEEGVRHTARWVARMHDADVPEALTRTTYVETDGHAAAEDHGGWR